MGTAAGAQKARERRETKARAARRAKRAAYEAELRARDVAAEMPRALDQPGGSDGALTVPGTPKPEQLQRVATGLIANSLPIAALTLTQAMTDKRSPWPVKLSAAIKTLELGGIQAPGGDAPADDLSDAELAAFIDAGGRALELRRATMSAADAEVVEP